MAGTASTVSNWLLLEHGGPWGRHALHDARLPEGLGRELDHLQRRHRVRILLIRRPDRRTQDGVTVFAVHSGPDEPWIERTVLDSIDQAAGLDLERLGHAERPGFEPSPDPLFVVCTHGRRDPCCAELGRPLARAVGSAFSDATWEGTHIGGDRFAGNMVAFPHGLYFGRLDERSGVEAASAYARGHDRPRPPARPVVQAHGRAGRRAVPASATRYDGSRRRHHRRMGRQRAYTTARASTPDGSLRRGGRTQDRRRSSADVPQRTRRTTHVVRAGVDRTDLKVRRSPAGPSSPRSDRCCPRGPRSA